jgi:hypothetical protein
VIQGLSGQPAICLDNLSLAAICVIQPLNFQPVQGIFLTVWRTICMGTVNDITGTLLHFRCHDRSQVQDHQPSRLRADAVVQWGRWDLILNLSFVLTKLWKQIVDLNSMPQNNSIFLVNLDTFIVQAGVRITTRQLAKCE